MTGGKKNYPYSIHLYPFFPCSSLSLDNKTNLANTLCFFSYTGRQHLHFNSILEPQKNYDKIWNNKTKFGFETK